MAGTADPKSQQLVDLVNSSPREQAVPANYPTNKIEHDMVFEVCQKAASLIEPQIIATEVVSVNNN